MHARTHTHMHARMHGHTHRVSITTFHNKLTAAEDRQSLTLQEMDGPEG